MTKQEKLENVNFIMIVLKDIVKNTIETHPEEELYISNTTALEMLKMALEKYEEMMEEGE